ncbi:CocE/NonD family hydrolase [Aquidulcibacter sp.]|jgi:putative CocE/NonD family hydrolase|uniref:CocE/NonD family hydrolase n=1 Tax=Aquidulcibacter sp. TaxID=2052990 RepID=UPI003BA7061B
MANALVNTNDKSAGDAGVPGRVEVVQNVMIPMRDGIRLATDVYLPVDGRSQRPVVLERTPYGKQSSNHGDRTYLNPVPKTRPEIARWFASKGYAYVLQDCRGRNGSEGVFSKYVNEGDDGEDTLKWLLAQDWCNGKVATLGLSYGAHVQAALASLNPHGLAAMVWDSGGFSNAWKSGIRQGGAFELKQLTWAMTHARLSPATLNDPVRRANLEAQNIRDWIGINPWSEGRSPLAMAPEYESYVLELWRNETFSAFWRRQGLYAAANYEEFSDAPTMFICSWYDPYSLTTIENFEGLSKRKAGPYRMILGPWTHGQRSVTHSGDVDFGSSAPLDGNIAIGYDELRLDWFDQQIATPTEQRLKNNLVQVFVMGGGSGLKTHAGKMDHGGKWRNEPTWPIPNAVATPLYLTKESILSLEPSEQSGSIHWVHDPKNPVGTRGGAIASGAPVMEAGAFDQGQLPSQSIASFQTEVLDRDLEVTGPITAKLWVSSSAVDTDICLKLLDVYPPNQDYPDGYAMNLSHGILRLRFRNACEKTELMTPMEVYPIEVTVFPTSNLFVRGHRIRLDVSSSNFPHFDVNPNTGHPAGLLGPEPIVATNKVHFGPETPSCIIVPFVRSEEY